MDRPEIMDYGQMDQYKNKWIANIRTILDRCQALSLIATETIG